MEKKVFELRPVPPIENADVPWGGRNSFQDSSTLKPPTGKRQANIIKKNSNAPRESSK